MWCGNSGFDAAPIGLARGCHFPAQPVPAAPAPPAQGGGALKVVLIIVGVIALLGVLSVASIGFFGWRVAHHAHIHQDGNNVKVDTPFGSVETTKDPAEAARNLGVDLYPGAEVSKMAPRRQLSEAFTLLR